MYFLFVKSSIYFVFVVLLRPQKCSLYDFFPEERDYFSQNVTMLRSSREALKSYKSASYRSLMVIKEVSPRAVDKKERAPTPILTLN
jgi:hypothetical protein